MSTEAGEKKVVVVATAELRAAYQSLLREEWTSETPRDAVEVLLRLLEKSHVHVVFSWDAAGDTAQQRRKRQRRYELPPNASDSVRQFVESLSVDIPEEGTERKRDGRDSQRTKLARLAEQVFALLVFQKYFKLEGDLGLFRDLQSMVFSSATQFLVPKVREHGMENEYQMLVSGLFFHSLLWTDQPSHQFFLQSLIFDCLGDESRSADALWYSLRTSDPGDHDYLTKAQAYWSALMERQDYEKAEEILLQLHRTVPAEALDELRGWLRETYREKYAAGA
jgi:hypothetical protein